MLNRRILRIKAFKTIFCYAENPGMTLKEAEAMLELSCESVRDLYLFLLAIIGPLTGEARARIEAARSKFNPSEEELNPNMKFVENRIAPLLADDPDFCKLVQRKKLSWGQCDVLLRQLYESIRSRKYFRDYLDSPGSSLEEDARLWCRIFEREFEDRADLADILEDLSIWWNDDLGYALSWCCRSVRSLGAGERWTLPPLYRSPLSGKEGCDDDRRFVTTLLRTAFSGFERYSSAVAELTPKWNRDRLCTTDLALIVCGMAESEAFPDTSERIIINEYVEISKSYSTPESSGFVNGLLDRLIRRVEVPGKE